jgi:hypothetical protein
MLASPVLDDEFVVVETQVLRVAEHRFQSYIRSNPLTRPKNRVSRDWDLRIVEQRRKKSCSADPPQSALMHFQSYTQSVQPAWHTTPSSLRIAMGW